MRKGKTRPGYEHVNVHMIFDINMDGGLTRKLLFVAGGHTTSPTSQIIYSSAVSRDSVRIAFILVFLKNL